MTRPPGSRDSWNGFRCSFCDAQHGDAMLVSGPSVFVCDGCVATIPPATTDEKETSKERDLLVAVDAGLASRRTKPGVWERISAKVWRAQAKR